MLVHKLVQIIGVEADHVTAATGLTVGDAVAVAKVVKLPLGNAHVSSGCGDREKTGERGGVGMSVHLCVHW